MGLWPADDPSRATQKASTSAGEDATGARSRESQARESREETAGRHQEERQEWPNGTVTNTGKRSCEDKKVRAGDEYTKRANHSVRADLGKIYTKVLFNANTTSSNIVANTGIFDEQVWTKSATANLVLDGPKQ